MSDEGYLETLYDGNLSYYNNQKAWVPGDPKPKTRQSKKSGNLAWKVAIRQHTHEMVKELHKIQKYEECNFFVTFFINKFYPENPNHKRLLSDVDNLSRELLTELAKCAKPSDLNVRGIRAEKEMVKEKTGAKIQYVITKSFKIISVEEKPGDKFRNYWESPMQYIIANEMNGNVTIRKCKFIDNMPGQLFLVANEYAKLIPPGYDWEKHKGGIVDGCMVFEKKVQEKHKNDEKENKEPLFWLTKW